MKLLNLGNESIAFQSGDFFRDLTLIVTDLRTLGRTDDSLTKARDRITKCIYDHTGIVVRYNEARFGDDAFILIPAMARGNVLNHHEYAKRLETVFHPSILKNYTGLEQKGWIDPATSRVGGEFSKFVYNMYIGPDFIYGNHYTAEETAAVVLHEVGHAFTFLQFVADTIIVNNVLLRSYQELTSAKPDMKVKMVLTKAADDLEIKNRDWIQSIEDNEAGAVAFKVLASAVQIEPRRMDNKKYFSQFAAEELADIFAARHGAGRAIISMRSKYSLQGRNYGYMRMVAFTVVSMMSALILPQIGIPLAALGMLTMMNTAAEHAGNAMNMVDVTSYKQSATKIRNQFVEQLKSTKDLPKEQVMELIDSVVFADRLIQGYKGEFHPDLMTRFFDMFRREKMDARSSRAYTDKLEVLAANDLFVRAAEFSV